MKHIDLLLQQSKGWQIRMKHLWLQMNLTPSGISWRDCTHQKLKGHRVKKGGLKNFCPIQAFFLSSYHINVTSCNLCARAKVKGHIELKIEENTSENWSSHFKFGSCIGNSDLWAMAGKNGTVSLQQLAVILKVPFRPNLLLNLN